MDIFKVLSRGIKPTAKKGNSSNTPLPSAGARPNPQFFHDLVAGAAPRGKKRKRKARKSNEIDNSGENSGGKFNDDDKEDVSDVDFFADSETKQAKPKLNNSHLSSAKDDNHASTSTQNLAPLDGDTIRATLRSHRLKFTILAGSTFLGDGLAEDGEETKPNKKKQKKHTPSTEDEGKEKKKKGKDQLAPVFPRPLRAFGELKYGYRVHPTVCDNLVRQGFCVPTEVQMGSLPLLLRPGTALPGSGSEKGVDFLGVAPTGSGKTVSFLVPAIDAVLKSRGSEEEAVHVLSAVVVAPTRELASQIVNEGRKLALGTGVRVVLMKRALRLDVGEGGEGEEGKGEGSDEEDEDEDEDEEEAEESQEEEQGEKDVKANARVDILVTTPKVLLNFLSAEKTPGKKAVARKTLPSVTSLILDEADVLLDPIFQKQTMAIWRACTNLELSLTCWSATMASHIEALIAKEISKRARCLGTSRPLIRLVVGLKDTAVPNVTHKLMYTATEQGKLLAIRQLLHPVSSVDSGPPLRPPFLVFTQTIERAQALHDELQYDIPPEAGGSSRIAVLHSSLSGSVRSKIMTRFRTGEVWVLITTDVLARGVDFAGVNGVVNYDVPGSAAAYVHRAGRTGRAGREGGVAVTFYTKDDIPFVKSVANVIAASEKQAARAGAEGVVGGTVQKWLLDALPKVAKEEKRKLKVRGVESRRTGGKASITTKSSWERKRENNRRQAIEASKKRKREGRERHADENDDEWGGLD